ncbi:MAG TPA: hypothetical protein VMJ33_02560 [Gallionella sp.]|nr:hypothetical protein [Gallionella sp.]
MKTTKKAYTSVVTPILIIALTANLASCGTILYPERHNQKAGQIDPAVAILDGIGLLFYIIPGVIAFAVDFSNHSIYLPQGHSSHKFSQIQVDKKLDLSTLEESIRNGTGKAVDLQQSNIKVFRLDSAAELDSAFALYDTNGQIALAR